MARLHDDTLGAATSALAGLGHVHLVVWGAGTEGSGAGGVGGHLLVVAADLADEVVESVFDVHAGLGGGLDELATELSGQGFTFYMRGKEYWLVGNISRRISSDLTGGLGLGRMKRNRSLGTLFRDDTVLLQIALVTDNNDGEIVLVLDAENLLLEGHDFFEGLTRCDRVDEQEALAGAHVLFPHCRVLLLACRIENVQESDLIVDNTLLAVGVWKKRITGDERFDPGLLARELVSGRVGISAAHLQLSGRTRPRSGSGSAGSSSTIFRHHHHRQPPTYTLAGTRARDES